MFLVTLRCLSVLAPLGGRGHLMLSPCLESQICQLIPLTFLSLLFLFSIQSRCSFWLSFFCLWAFLLAFFSFFLFLQKSLQICFVKAIRFLLLCFWSGSCWAAGKWYVLLHGTCICHYALHFFLVVLMFLSIHLLLSPSPSQPLNKSDIKNLVGRVNEAIS